MAPKKRVLRTVKETNNNSYRNLTLNNVLCPICRNIFVEPVTLPCSHGFCLSCFEGTVANANLTCPLCRVRFGSWHRIAKKENRIVNSFLWKAVQETFPEQVKNRLQGIDENLDKDSQFVVHVASPGAIRMEYEAQKEKEELRLKMEREAEEQASKLLIEKLKEEDEYEDMVRKEKLRIDEQIAQKIAEKIQVEPSPKKHKKNNNTLDNFVVNKKDSAQVMLKPLQLNALNKTKRKLHTQTDDEDDFLKDSSDDSNKYDSTDSSNTANEIDGEFKYFKPIEPTKSTFKMSPLKVPVKPKKISTIIFRAPKGRKNTVCRAINSAFVYFKPQIRIDLIDITYPTLINSKQKLVLKTDQERKLKPSNSHLSSKLACDIVSSPTKRQCFSNDSTKHSITTIASSIIAPLLASEPVNSTQASCSSWKNGRSSSPFMGFPIRTEENHDVKMIQEKSDREFALKLHEELNSNRLNRGTTNLRKRPRQAKLEELVKPINIAAKY